jgi:hypothetical protein
MACPFRPSATGWSAGIRPPLFRLSAWTGSTGRITVPPPETIYGVDPIGGLKLTL